MIYLFSDSVNMLESQPVIPSEIILEHEVTKELNGFNSVYIEYVAGEVDVSEAKYVVFMDSNNDFQMYKILSKGTKGTVSYIEGVHKFLDDLKASDFFIEFEKTDVEPKVMLENALSNTQWVLDTSDTFPSGNISLEEVSPLEVLEEVLKKFPIEIDYWIEFDNNSIVSQRYALRETLGVRKNKFYEYGSNVLNIEVEHNTSEIYTAAIGLGATINNEDNLPQEKEVRVDFSNVIWSKSNGNPLDKPKGYNVLIDDQATIKHGYFENGKYKPRITYVVFDEIDDPNELIKETHKWLVFQTLPKAVYRVEVFDGDNVNLGDEVAVRYADIGVSKWTKVSMTKENLIAGKKDIYFGDVGYFNSNSTKEKLEGEIDTLKKGYKKYSQRIYEMKLAFDKEFVDRVNAIENEYQLRLDLVTNQIQADKEAFELQYEADKEALSGEIQSSYDNAVTEANRIVEAKETDFKNYADGIGSAANGRIDSLYDGLGDLSSEFENLEIGGRNLLRNSNRIWRKNVSENYVNLPFMFTEVGEHTISFKAVVETENVPFNQHLIYVGRSIAYANRNDSERTYATFTIEERDLNKYVFLYLGENASVSRENGGYFDLIKIEKGNKATDWTPAPEDVEQKLTIIANDLDGVQTKVEDNTGNISTVTQLANGLETRVTDAEGNINTITNLANGTQQTVTNMLNGTATKGTVFQNTVDGFLGRVWEQDIDSLSFENRNLLKNTDFTVEKNVSNLRETASGNVNISQSKPPDYDKTFARSQATLVTGNNIGFQTRNDRFKVEEGHQYTLSFIYIVPSTVDENMTYTYLMNPLTNAEKPNQKLAITSKTKIGTAFTSFNVFKATFTFTANWSEDNAWLLIASNVISNGNAWVRISEPKLEKGSKATPYSQAPEDFLKHTDLVLKSDGFLIGTFEMGGDKIAQAIVGKAGAIDLIADNVNFTGNVNVANQIKAYSLEAVYADIAKLRTNILTANSVEATALKVDTALINKLNTNSILTNYLIADTAMINNIKSKSLEAVYADISELRTRLLVADVITANMVKFDTALIEKFTSSTAFINSLTAKSAFINTAKVTELISTDGRDSFTLAGGQMNWVRSTGQTMQLGIDGIYMKNANGSIRFQMDTAMVTSAALGTSNSNVYLATGTGFEARVVDRNQLPGSGAINDYTYKPMRALIYRFPDVPNAYFTLYNGGEFRFTGESTSNPVYQDVRANVFHGAGFRTTTTNLYLGTDNLVHVVNKGFVDGSTGSPIYRDLRANDIYNRALITTTEHAYIGADGELRVVNKGLSGIYRDIRFSSSYSELGRYYGQGSNLIQISAGFIQSESMFTRTYSYAANMYVTSNGIVGRSTSARKYKLAIEHQFADWQEQLNHSKKMLEIRPSTWFDRFESETYAEEIKLGERIDEEDFKVKRHFGAIADEFHELGLTELVQYNEDDEVEGLAYDRMSVHHNVLIKDLYDENDELKSEIAELKSQINKIMEMIA